MAKNFLTNDERLALIEKYKEDKLNNPPSNITDATLIKNYGTDEQKAKLQAAQPAAQPQGSENKGTNPATNTKEQAGQGAGDTNTELSAEQKERNALIEEYKDLHDGAEPAADIPNDEIRAANVTAGNLKAAAAQAQAQQVKDAEYVKAFNEYVDLYLVMPKDTLTTAELVALNEQKKAQNAAAQEQANNVLEQASKQVEPKAADTVTIVDNKTKAESVVPRFTWDKFISKDGTHSLKPELPAELR